MYTFKFDGKKPKFTVLNFRYLDRQAKSKFAVLGSACKFARLIG